MAISIHGAFTQAGPKDYTDYVRVYESVKGGWVDLHPWHGAQELEDNLATAKILADKGHCLQLLPTLHAHETVLRQHLLPDVFDNKNPDVRIVRVSQNDIGDIKTPNKNAVTKTTIKDGIYRAAQQKASVVIINLHQANYSFNNIKEALFSTKQPTRN